MAEVCDFGIRDLVCFFNKKKNKILYVLALHFYIFLILLRVNFPLSKQRKRGFLCLIISIIFQLFNKCKKSYSLGTKINNFNFL